MVAAVVPVVASLRWLSCSDTKLYDTIHSSLHSALVSPSADPFGLCRVVYCDKLNSLFFSPLFLLVAALLCCASGGWLPFFFSLIHDNSNNVERERCMNNDVVVVRKKQRDGQAIRRCHAYILFVVGGCHLVRSFFSGRRTVVIPTDEPGNVSTWNTSSTLFKMHNTFIDGDT